MVKHGEVSGQCSICQVRVSRIFVHVPMMQFSLFISMLTNFPIHSRCILLVSYRERIALSGGALTSQEMETDPARSTAGDSRTYAAVAVLPSLASTIALSRTSCSWWRSLSCLAVGSRISVENAPKNLVASATPTPFFIPRRSGPPFNSTTGAFTAYASSTFVHARKRKLGNTPVSCCAYDGLQHAIYIAGHGKVMPVIILSNAGMPLGRVVTSTTNMPHVIHLLSSKTQNLACGVVGDFTRLSCVNSVLTYFQKQPVSALDEELQARTAKFSSANVFSSSSSSSSTTSCSLFCAYQ